MNTTDPMEDYYECNLCGSVFARFEGQVTKYLIACDDCLQRLGASPTVRDNDGNFYHIGEEE